MESKERHAAEVAMIDYFNAGGLHPGLSWYHFDGLGILSIEWFGRWYTKWYEPMAFQGKKPPQEILDKLND